jgi:hypothetical protein
MSEEQDLRQRLEELEEQRRRYVRVAEECRAERLVLESQATSMSGAIADGDEEATDEYMRLYQKIRRLQVRQEAAERSAEPTAEMISVRNQLRQIRTDQEREEAERVRDRWRPEQAAVAGAGDIIGPAAQEVRPASTPPGESEAFVSELRERAKLFARARVHELHHDEGCPLLSDEEVSAVVERELARYGLVEREAKVERG